VKRLLAFFAACSVMMGCSLDRQGLGMPHYHDGAMDVSPDANIDDGSLDVSPDADTGVDASMDADTDATMDASPDADAGDAGPSEDGGPSDTGVLDSGMLDSGPPDAGFTSCSTETGNCLRFQNTAGSPETAEWMIDVIWTLMGGSVDDSGYAPVACIGGIRREDALTTECRFTLPARPATAIGLALVYMYPRYADMSSPCTVSGCSNYPSGYVLWSEGLPKTIMLERRPTPAGSIMVLRVAL